MEIRNFCSVLNLIKIANRRMYVHLFLVVVCVKEKDLIGFFWKCSEMTAMWKELFIMLEREDAI